MNNEPKSNNDSENNSINEPTVENDTIESFADKEQDENIKEVEKKIEFTEQTQKKSTTNVKENSNGNGKNKTEKEIKDPEKVTILLDIKKIKMILIITTVVIALILLLVLLFGLIQPERYAVIKMLNGEIYRGKIILITDNKLYYKKGKDVFDDFEIAYSENLDFDISFSTENLDEVESIHYILMKQNDEIAEPPVTKKSDDKYDTNIFGTYKIFLSGHEGYLYLRYKNGRVYGGVKFPNWANGVYEPLKDVKIKNGQLSFTRSATTLKEIRRIGISSYFTQTFTGKLYPKTAEIKGFFKNSGARQSWRAEKIK